MGDKPNIGIENMKEEAEINHVIEKGNTIEKLEPGRLKNLKLCWQKQRGLDPEVPG